jgi:hypothetical protein
MTAVAAARDAPKSYEAFINNRSNHARIPIPGCAFSALSGAHERQGKRAMMKTFSLAASIMVLVAISGQAFAGTVAPVAGRHSRASMDRPAMRAYDAATPATVDVNTHHYHGGPKVND